MTKINSLPELLEMDQWLRDRHGRHPRQVQDHYDILCQVAPTLAAIPIPAITWLRSSLDQGSLGPTDIKNLAEVEIVLRKVCAPPTGTFPIRADALAQARLVFSSDHVRSADGWRDVTIQLAKEIVRLGGAS